MIRYINLLKSLFKPEKEKCKLIGHKFERGDLMKNQSPEWDYCVRCGKPEEALGEDGYKLESFFKNKGL
ncbi:MAG: DUF1660 family phage protein [Streptococcaceae bacterium]|jgi:hypothetical protein|nr:DUF1660 family phage protein [Streptococcaceae bacterium]